MNKYKCAKVKNKYSMVRVSYSSFNNFHVMISSIKMAEQKGKGYRGIKTIKTFQYEYALSDFRFCAY